MNGEGTTGWHLDKRVPLTIIFALIMQTLGLVYWGVKIDARVAVLEKEQPEQNLRLTTLESERSQIAIIQDRQNRVIATLDASAKKLDDLISLFNNNRK